MNVVVRAVMIVPLAVCACGGGSDGDDSAGSAPDVSGRYQSFVTSIVGCENDPQLVQSWAQGPLTVESTGSSLELDYGDGASLSGTIDDKGEFYVGGAFTSMGLEMDGRKEGQFVSDDGVWTMSGRFTVTVDDGASGTQPCTLEADSEATQIAR